ncbi:MAG: peptidoglycan DD-metalloendopeptidase family protein [Candidatus Gracilibacteria bacterium]
MHVVFSHGNLRKRILSLVMVVFFGSASILPSFAAVGTAATPVFDGDGMYISMQADDIDELAKNFDSVYVGEDGILSNPILGTDDAGRITSNNLVEYTVKGGDTLGGIAARYGISTETLIGANGLKATSMIKEGQTLKVLPVDGVLYTIDNDTNVAEIAKKYSLDPVIIANQNELSDDAAVLKGSQLILPGLKLSDVKPTIVADTTPAPTVAANVAQTTPKKTTATVAVTAKKTTTAAAKKTTPKTSEPTEQGLSLRWPTASPVITQKFHSGHPAIDICYTKGNHTTGIVAAKGGKVIKAQGGYNGGYGNMIIIDHGDGLRTLYAHMKELYVTPGQQVSAGETIGWMGNTGRSYGRTGLHLHFEVIKNNVRMNPLSYL